MSIRFAVAGLLFFVFELTMLLTYGAWSEEMSPISSPMQDEPPTRLAAAESGNDATILAQCMNGQSIALDDGEIMTCRIRRKP